MESIRLEMDGDWISELGNREIHCKVVNDELQCTWPNGYFEKFHIHKRNLTGVANKEIVGMYNDEGFINFNTGNKWILKGIVKIEKSFIQESS